MHEAFWNGLFDVRWEGAPLGPEAIRLVLRLRRLGYSERTRRDYGLMVVHLGRVLAGESRADAGTLDEGLVDGFVDAHLPTCCCYRRGPDKRYENARRALGHLLAMLREEGLIVPRAPPRTAVDALLDEYGRFLLDQRGLAQTTVTNYRRYVRAFLNSRHEALTPAALVQVTPDDLLAFGRGRAAALGATSWNHLALSLRAFYRWLHLSGHGGGHLATVIPLRRRYRLADVPCALRWEQVQALLASVERDGPDGRRNYAMLLLIATYGLRGCEVRALGLDDIDWQQEELTVFASKTGCSRRLPLTGRVGEAILDYLRHERPASHHRDLFLSRRPPQGPLCNKFYGWVARCFEKAGIEAPHRGAHTLRHSLAVELLRRGETLKGIGDILGHRSPETTFIYTKLDVEDLRSVALDPEVVS